MKKLALGSRRTLILALLLAFLSEILLWDQPELHFKSEVSFLALGGYFALALFLLFLAERFRVRNAFGLFVLAGIYGLLSSLLINPETAFIEIPRTLFSRVMGAHTLMGLTALNVLYLLYGVRPRRELILYGAGFFVMGIAGGIWGRWSPVEFQFGAGLENSILTLLMSTIVSGAIITISVLWAKEDAHETETPSPLGWFVCIGGFVSLLLLQFFSENIDGMILLITCTFVIFCLVILWYLRRQQGMMLNDLFRKTALQPKRLLLVFIPLVIGVLIGYHLPRQTGSNDLLLWISFLFTGFGISWLPAVAVVIGGRAFMRSVQQSKL